MALSLADRALGAVIGAAVADAASKIKNCDADDRRAYSRSTLLDVSNQRCTIYVFNNLDQNSFIASHYFYFSLFKNTFFQGQ